MVPTCIIVHALPPLPSPFSLFNPTAAATSLAPTQPRINHKDEDAGLSVMQMEDHAPLYLNHTQHSAG